MRSGGRGSLSKLAWRFFGAGRPVGDFPQFDGQKRVIADRYGNGATIPELAEEHGVGVMSPTNLKDTVIPNAGGVDNPKTTPTQDEPK